MGFSKMHSFGHFAHVFILELGFDKLGFDKKYTF